MAIHHHTCSYGCLYTYKHSLVTQALVVRGIEPGQETTSALCAGRAVVHGPPPAFLADWSACIYLLKSAYDKGIITTVLYVYTTLTFAHLQQKELLPELWSPTRGILALIVAAPGEGSA